MPLYDVISFLPYHTDKSQLKLSMTIGGRRQTAEIKPQHWQRTAEWSGYPVERMLQTVRELLKQFRTSPSRCVRIASRPGSTGRS